MHRSTAHISSNFPRRTLLVGALVCAAALGIAVPLAAATTITFTTDTPDAAAAAAPAADVDGMFGKPSPVALGTTAKKLVIKTNKQDLVALKNQKTINGLDDQLDDSVTTTNDVSSRIDAIEQLLDQTEQDQDKLRAQVEARLVEQYQSGDTANIAYLLAGGASDILDRAHALRDSSKRDANLYNRYELTLDRLDELHAVLTELRSIEGERTENIGDRIDRLSQTLVDAHAAHDSSSLAVMKTDKGEAEAEDGDAAGGGTWYIMGGAFQAGLYMPGVTGMGTGQYNGGTKLPHEPPTQQSVAAVMELYKAGVIDLDSQGLNDIQTMQIDDRILQSMVLAAQQFHFIKITMLKTGHSVYTAGGNVSEHSYGCAMDIGTIGSTFIQPSTQVPGGEVEAAVKFFAGLTGNLAPHQVISLFSLGGPTLALSDHGDHIHVGYHC